MFDPKWLLLIGGVLLTIAGCNVDVSGHARQSDPGQETIAEGTIFSVKYDYGDGRVGGFTRFDAANTVPGGNGSWNVNAQGRLTSQYLIITYPGRKELGPHVIPADRLFEVQFGDGGIRSVRGEPGLESVESKGHSHDHGHGDH
jgi:hypothetical protein